MKINKVILMSLMLIVSMYLLSAIYAEDDTSWCDGYMFDEDEDGDIINLDEQKNGVLVIYPPESNESEYRVAIRKKGYEIQVHGLFGDEGRYTLSMGYGMYEIYMFEIVDDEANLLWIRIIDINDFDQDKLYLNSVEDVAWNSEDDVIKFFNEAMPPDLPINITAFHVYRTLADKYTYDHKKAESLTGLYEKDLNSIFNLDMGICGDFSALFASVMRSKNIPCRYVTGYRKDSDVYHAWNEIYVNGAWKTVDLTLGVYRRQANMKTVLYENSNEYIGYKIQ